MQTAPQEQPPTSEPSLHSIGEAAEAAGLTPQALRMWEDRYGRPVAVRLPSGHRRYTDEQVRWLRRVADALAQGHRAGAVVRLDEEALDSLLAEALPKETLGRGPRRMLEWLRSYGADEIRAWLEARWDPSNYLRYLKEEIAPLMVAVGRGWADGDLDVRHEHLLSEILEDELRGRRREFQHLPNGPSVLFATLPGELHGLGLQLTALGAAAHGLRVHLLGPDTPIDSIVNAATDLGVSMVAISVSSSGGGAGTDRALLQVRAALPDRIRIVAGGAGMQRVRRNPKGVECPEGLDDWDALVRSLAEGAGHSA